MSMLVKLIGSGIGLTSEAIHAARARSKESQSTQASSSTLGYVNVDPDTANELVRSGQAERVDENENDYSEIANDEAVWELDEMAESVRGTHSEEEGPAVPETEEISAKRNEEMIRQLLRMAGLAPQPIRRLERPVIIPQRRPRNKTRGFVRAYAPILADCGINQDTFLQFLLDFDRASKASPWIDVVMVAASIAGFVPELSAQIISTVVQIAAGTAKELQSRSRKNSFLDRVNDELFMPRGLFAMVMAFKDEVPGQQRGMLSQLSKTLGQTIFSSEKLDINQTAAKYSQRDPEMSKLKKGLRDIRLTSGKTHGEIELPESAALVYPDLDRIVANAIEDQSNGKGKTTSAGSLEKLKSAGVWVQDYLDRKAQAEYEAEYPKSSLAVPSTERVPFKSRYSDPNHPANSGSLISLLTGGAINPPPLGGRLGGGGLGGGLRGGGLGGRAGRSYGREFKGARRVPLGRSPSGAQRQLKQRMPKILQQDVLYLLVVHLPSQEEIQESTALLELALQQVEAASR
ncbi:hypothetical protein N7495_001149 [Penicillium taxi]|uniref:uncharacterized protein n=1 Tax=Penicillium taxi TaxID=168475 RepID=UPI00254510F0|nr:uncharacterized protein N7495_001149 [Penicillium taxi]KAJ5908467.1 hypothetical protein N7495_001149 [Penicillium taxi]